MAEETRDTAGVSAPPPLIYLGALGLGFVAEWLLLGADLSGAFTWVGIALIALGLGIDAWFTISLRRARTPVNPYSPTAALVTSGPYAFSRNPAYVGMAVAYVGIAFVAEAPLSERTVRQALQRSQGRPGAGRLRELIGDGLANGATRFEAERRFRRLLRAAELPRPDFNVRVGPYLVDALWPEHRLAALKVLRFTWRRITRHPVAVAATVARELALRSGS